MTAAHAIAGSHRLAAGGTDPLALGAALSAVGAVSVVATSAFYVASPGAVAGPAQPLDLAAAIQGAASGAATLRVAGTIGIFGDLTWAVAVLLIAQAFALRGRGVAAAGWFALFLSILIFTLVDGMTGFVFPAIARSAASAGFEGFKRFWDMLFQLGVIAFGVGLLAALGADRSSPEPMVGRRLAYATMAVGSLGALGAAAGMAGFAGAPTDKIAGASIGLGSALLVAVSLQIRARVRRS